MIKQIDAIIKNIKEGYSNIVIYSISLFEQIHKLYKKIIDIFNFFNDNGYQMYVQGLQMFLNKYK